MVIGNHWHRIQEGESKFFKAIIIFKSSKSLFIYGTTKMIMIFLWGIPVWTDWPRAIIYFDTGMSLLTYRQSACRLVPEGT